MEQNSSLRKFTTSGLRPPVLPDGSIQRKPQQVSRKSFPQIGKFEREFLFSKTTFSEMSPEDQALIQQKAQEAFFAWIMSTRGVSKSTTPIQKKKMYEEIVQKLLISSEIQSFARPAFGNEDAFDLPVDMIDSPRSLVSPFDGLLIDGVIPFPQPIQSECIPFSQPLSPTQESMNFLDHLSTFSLNGSPFAAEPAYAGFDAEPTFAGFAEETAFAGFAADTAATGFAADTAATGSAEDSSVPMRYSSVFKILPFLGVNETLSDIWNIQAQISGVFGSSFDQSLGPNDFLDPLN